MSKTALCTQNRTQEFLGTKLDTYCSYFGFTWLTFYFIFARHADIAINMGWQQPNELLFHLRPQFGQIRLLAPIAPPFHIDFVFLIVFHVFRDRID